MACAAAVRAVPFGRLPRMTSLLLQSAENGGHHVVNELPFPAVWFGVIALTAFLALLGLLWSFRNTLALDPVAHEAHGTAGVDDAHRAGHAGRH